MEAPKPPTQYVRPADQSTNEAAEARAELARVLKTPGARRKLRNATTQIQAFTPPEGTQAAT